MAHMATILVNTIKILAISFFSTSNFSVHESEIVNFLWLKQILQIEMNYLNLSYNQRKCLWLIIEDSLNKLKEELIYLLMIHSYDPDIVTKKV